MGDSVIAIAPNQYAHVLDTNTNVTRVECGPCTITRQSHEELVYGPADMIIVPPSHFCYITNPVVRDADGNVVTDEYGIPKHKWSDHEVRTFGPPFPLYPNEALAGRVQPLHIVSENSALRLRAKRDYEDDTVVDPETNEPTVRVAGDEWLFPGPATYCPCVEVEVVETVDAITLTDNQALRLRTLVDCVDSTGAPRRAGQEWLVRNIGNYMPGVDEIVVGVVDAVIITETKALQLRALRSFTDVYGTARKAGEEWLITLDMSSSHIIDVNEEKVDNVYLTTLTFSQYVVIHDPIENGVQRLGQTKQVTGETAFFLQPGESIPDGIQEIIVLRNDQALLLRALKQFDDDSEAAEGGKPTRRRPGDCWLLNGPRNYIPPVEVEIVDHREAIPLDETEGVYVQDMRTGTVRAVIGQTYMLQENEELWEKELPDTVEGLLAGRTPFVGGATPSAGSNMTAIQGIQSTVINNRAGTVNTGMRYDRNTDTVTRDKTRVVTFRVPHNSAVQIYDYRRGENRIVFGPDFVMLGPDEQFTQLTLSGGKPKRAGQIRTIMLMLGPDFMTDVVLVETSDHARLSLTLSYNWYFDTSTEDAGERLFSIPDFVGDACKSVASRVRGAVASVPFHEFHKASARLIRGAVFGFDDTGRVHDEFRFKDNNLVITNIDIQNAEPVDQRTRDALQRSVQLAIEITTDSLEQAASFEAEKEEQAARGELERAQIVDSIKAEGVRIKLLKVQAECAAVESTGTANAEAKARARAAEIEGTAAIDQAKLMQQALNIEAQASLKSMTSHRSAKLDHQFKLNDLELNRRKELARIETEKFKSMVGAIGSETIKSLAQAGPEMQVQLLQSLGLSGYLVTDGNSPINLFNTAQGLVGGAAGAAGGAPIM